MAILGVIHDLTGIDLEIRNRNDVLRELGAHKRPLNRCCVNTFIAVSGLSFKNITLRLARHRSVAVEPIVYARHGHELMG
jgi:hypothetical protein